jgi:hypothetical protein
VAFKKNFDLSPEASNTFKLPIFEISILEDEKSPWALVQILSPGGARGVYFVLPTVKKLPDDVIEKSANIIQPICSGMAKMYCRATHIGKLISKSGFFPCQLVSAQLSAERQALGPLLLELNFHAKFTI